MSNLTPKQLKFCNLYLELGCNATKAYLRSGYKIKSEVEARSCASRLLTNVNVKNYIKEQQRLLQELNIIKTDDIIQALARIAFGGLSDALEIDELGELRLVEGGNLNNVEKIEVKKSERINSITRSISVKSVDRLKAIDLICKILGFYRNSNCEYEDKIYNDQLLNSLRSVLTRYRF